MPSSPVPGPPPLQNELLAALLAEDLDRLRPHCRRVTLVMGQVLHEPGAPIGEVYFVQEGLVSLIADTGDAGLVEVGMTGREGLVGAVVLLDPEAVSTHRAVVQVPGHALRMGVDAFRDAVGRSPALRDRCMRHLQTLLVQASQAAACNARHDLPERLARWLLMTHDRAGTDELPMRQEFLGQMLGVRRAGVSTALGALETMGVIRHARGRITVLDRPGLEAEACNCYRVIRNNERRVMGEPPAR